MTRLRWLVALAVVVIILLQAQAVPWPARIVTALLVAVLPVASVAQLRLIEDVADLPRASAYASSVLTLWILAGRAGAAAWLSGITAGAMGLRALPPIAMLGWSVALTAGGIGMMVVLRRAGLRESALLLHLLPVTRGERMAFAGVSFTAGFCEELLFRGFLLVTLTQATGSILAAVVISTVVFGWVHAYQRPAGAVRAGLLCAVLALPAVVAESVVPSMIAHTAIDLIGGLWLRDRALS